MAHKFPKGGPCARFKTAVARRKCNKRVSAKITHLIEVEGKPQKQAVAMALSMERAGRLGPRGEYRPVGASKGTPKGTPKGSRVARAQSGACPEVAKSQAVRVADVLLLGPATIAAGLAPRKLPWWARVGFVVYGVGTVWYNGKNWLATREAARDARGRARRTW